MGMFCTAVRRDCVGGAARPHQRAPDKGARQVTGKYRQETGVYVGIHDIQKMFNSARPSLCHSHRSHSVNTNTPPPHIFDFLKLQFRCRASVPYYFRYSVSLKFL